MEGPLRSIGGVVALPRVRTIPWRRGLVGLLLLALLLLPMRQLFGATATSMEEGSIVEYATLTLHGATPMKDFWTEYGPLNVYVPTAAFAVTGPSVTVERTLGLGYRLVLLASIVSLLRRFSRRGAWIGAAICWVAIAPFGLMAYSFFGGLAFALASLACTTRALDHEEPDRRFLLAGGIAAGIALGFRPDLFFVVAIPTAVLCWRRRGVLRPLLAATGATLVLPYGVLLATAGFSNVVRCLLVDPLVHLRAGRALPLPPSFAVVGEYFNRVTSYSAALQGKSWLGAQAAVQIAEFFWVIVAVGLLLLATLVGPLRTRDRRWIALAVTALLLSSDFLQRADLSHLRQVGCVWLAIAPVALSVVLKRRTTSPTTVITWGAVGLCLLVFLVAPVQMGQAYTSLFGRLPAQRHDATIFVSHAGRTVPTGSWIEAAFMGQIVHAAERIAHPGSTLFEGPIDLRFTNYNEPILYWLLPNLRPSTYYLEMNPGISNTATSGLAAQVRNASELILSKRYTSFDEPNASTKPGWNGPNVVVEQHFCWVLSNPYYALLRRVRGALLDPATMPAADVVAIGNHLEARCSAPALR